MASSSFSTTTNRIIVPADQDNQRPRITLIANPYSVHVARWLKLFRLAGIEVRIQTAEAPHTENAVDAPVQFLVPTWFRGPALLRYVWAGIAAARQRGSRNEWLHAHCTSGSGFAAWLSRRPYIVTTYGSEVFGAADRGRLYRWMIHRVLSGAVLVTATTPRMTATLRDDFGVPAERIRTFSLGYDADVFQPVGADRQKRIKAPHKTITPSGARVRSVADGPAIIGPGLPDGQTQPPGIGVLLGALRSEFKLPARERLWVINRRSLPLYRTVEVVSGFLQYCSTLAEGRLVVLSGDEDPAYGEQVRQVIAASPHSSRVRLVREFLPAADVARWLQAADFAISVPKTDQLSTSILEAMACETVPVLAALEAYQPLQRCPGAHWVTDYSARGFAKMFADTSTLTANELRQHQLQCARFVEASYAETRILDDVRALYEFESATRTEQDQAA